MSFYASQVGKTSSRYCNSNLYGTNLSSVYADGPPPLDDSTQDEDDDEMVFRDPSPCTIKSHKNQEEKEMANSKQSDFQPWLNDDSNEQSASGHDFGDFSGFADFSSVFGSTNESKTNVSSWFNSNGDCNQSGGTLSSEKGLKSKDFSNSDDEFGCFSGGDESDFDDFQGFSNVNQNKNTNETKESEKSVNGLETGNGLLTHGITGNNVRRSDFFSDDDDDDEFDELQSSNQIDSSDKQTNSNTAQNIPNSIESRAMPSIFSDDDDDDFGEFSDNNVASDTLKEKALHIDTRDSTSKDIDSSHSVSSHNDSSISTFLSKEESSIQQENNKDNGNFAIQKSDIDESEALSCESEQSRQQDCDISVDNADTESKAKCSSESNSSECRPEADIIKDSLLPNQLSDDGSGNLATLTDSQSANSQSKNAKDDDDGFSKLEIKSSTNDDGDDFGDFSTVSVSNTGKNISEDDSFGKLETKSSIPTKYDFGDFSTVSESNTGKNISDDDSFGKLETKSSIPTKDDGDDFGDFSSVSESNTQKNSNVSSLNEQQIKLSDSNDTSGNTETSKQDDNDSDDFAAVPSTPQSHDKTAGMSTTTSENDDFGSCSTSTSQLGGQNTAGNDDDDGFGDFSEVSSTTKPSASIAVDDFGDFSTICTTSTIDNKHGDDDNFGHFATFPQSHNSQSDDDFGAFATISTTSKVKDSQDNNDNFGHFSTFPQSYDSKPMDNGDNGDNGDDDGDGDNGGDDDGDDDGDFGEFGDVSSNKLQDDGDEFGDFSSISQPSVTNNEPSNKEFSNFKSSIGSGFANYSTASKTADDFEDFSSSPTPTPSTTNWSKSTAQCTENQITSSQSKSEMATILKPQKNTSISRICNTFEQSFVSVELAVQRNMIVVMLKNEIQAGKSSVWQSVKSSERDGSLRFEWMTSDHQLKMLEALSMLPVRVQTSASFKSSGPVQTPLFASGLGLLEPVKGVITPFHHGVEEINPSQDPFGAPPEVGIPDLGFGGGTGKKDTQTGHLEVKDSMDSISVSSSLDLDFLAPPSGNGESTKTESKGLYEDDLLGLGMQFSSTNDSPKVFNDQKKICKFNTTAISLLSDDNLNEPAKKIVHDFEDLSFMLSKVLMFPLKSNE